MDKTRIDLIILAGGKGTRLRTVLPDVPKVLAPINGKPFLDIILTFVKQYSSIKRVILAVGYRSEKIIEQYKDCQRYGFDVLFSQEQQLLGTGGAIKKALAMSDTEQILVINGDTFVEIDIDALMESHKHNNASITMVLKETDDTARYGSVRIDDNKRIVFFGEKEAGNAGGLINAGVYLINRSIFDDVKSNRVFSFEKEMLPGLAGGNIYGYIVKGEFIDIGIPETYSAAQEYFNKFTGRRFL